MAGDRNWMYQRLCGRHLNQDFVTGVHSFLNFAFLNSSTRTVRCPCSKCSNRKFNSRNQITEHLYRWGFVRGYFVWDCHGEQIHGSGSMSSNAVEVSDARRAQEETINSYTDMVFDVFHPQFNDNSESNADRCEEPNCDTQNFFDLLHEANVEIYEGCGKTVLGFVTEWLHTKQHKNATESCANGFLTTAVNNLIRPEVRCLIPDNMYKVKKMMKKMGLGYTKIDVCYNNCFLYYKDDEKYTECPHCKDPRYEMLSSGKKKARKKLWYLPVTPRLQRLYMSRKISEHMTWHEKCAQSGDKIIHPAGAEAWKHFDRTNPEFASEPRNVRLGLCTDGFNPFGNFSASYSCWPVFVTPYNLPPDLCVKPEYIFLSLIISGPQSPGKNIDVLLRPLIDELKILWETGAETYDSFRHQNFRMRAALLWTISDFPAYAMLSRWSTHGRMSCPYCIERTKAFQLVNGGKTSHFDCHRRFLCNDHPFRRNRKDFLKGKIDMDPRPHVRSGAEILESLQQVQFPDLLFGPRGKDIPGAGRWHNWTKKSIFWELPYWATNLIRHMLDVMHIERIFFENIRGTVMDDPDKTKDNAKARRDLALLTKRDELFLKVDESGKEMKPIAAYTLSKDENIALCKWLKNLRLPDGYASNISRRVNLQHGRLSGLKSHDCHVFMQRLLPIAFRDFLPDNIWGPLTEISNFFRALCASEISVSDMNVLEESIVVTLCKLEKIFPPGFFDSMEHLVVHLPYEAKMRGPVQYGWMYPFERRMFELKGTVHQKTYVEGSICEAYILREITNFCSHYFANDIGIDTRLNSLRRNEVERSLEVDSQLSIFTPEGRPIGTKLRSRVLSRKEYDAAQFYVLMNCDEVEPWLRMFDEQIGAIYLTDSEIIRRRTAEFVPWFKHVASSGELEIDQRLRPLIVGPVRTVDVYKGYMVNGFKFHTVSHGQGKKTMNSGVCVKATTGATDETSFYGILQEVIELEFWGSGRQQKIVLFNCDWYDSFKGLVVHPKYHVIDINPRKMLPDSEPYIFASQANQVYYASYPAQNNPRRRGWLAVIPIKARHVIDISSIDQQVYQENDPPVVDVTNDHSISLQMQLSNGDFEIVGEEPVEKEFDDAENDFCDEDIPHFDISDDEE